MTKYEEPKKGNNADDGLQNVHVKMETSRRLADELIQSQRELGKRYEERLAQSRREFTQRQRELDEKYTEKYGITLNKEGDLAPVAGTAESAPIAREEDLPVVAPIESVAEAAAESKGLEAKVAETPVVPTPIPAEAYRVNAEGERVAPQPAPAASDYQKDIMKMYGTGMTAKEIGERLGISSEEVGEKLRSYSVERRTQRIVKPNPADNFAIGDMGHGNAVPSSKDEPAAEAQESGRKTDALPTPEEIAHKDTRPLPDVSGEDIGGSLRDMDEVNGPAGEVFPGPYIPKKSFGRVAKGLGCLVLGAVAVAGSIYAAVKGKEYVDEKMKGNDKAVYSYVDRSIDRSAETISGKLEKRIDDEAKTTRKEINEVRKENREGNKAVADSVENLRADLQKRYDEEAKRAAEAKAEAGRKAVEETAQKAEEAVKKAAEEARLRADEEAKRKADEEARRAAEGTKSAEEKSRGLITDFIDEQTKIIEEAAVAEESAVRARREAFERAQAALAETERIAEDHKIKTMAALKQMEIIAEMEAKKLADEEAERQRVKGNFSARACAVTGDERGASARVNGGVGNEYTGVEADALYKRTESDSSSHEVAGARVEGRIGGKARISLTGGYESAVNESRSESISSGNEGVLFVQTSEEDSSTRSSRGVAGAEAELEPVDGVSISVKGSRDSRTTKGKTDVKTNVRFPTHPELAPIDISNSVRTRTRDLEDVLGGSVNVRLGEGLNAGAIVRAKRFSIDTSARVDGNRVIDEEETKDVYGVGLELGAARKDIAGRAIVLRHFGDVEASQEIEGAGHVVVPLSRFLSAGIGGGRVNGRNMGKIVGFLSGYSDVRELSNFMSARENKILSPDGTLDEQKLEDTFSRLEKLGMRGVVVDLGLSSGKDGKVDGEAAVSVPLQIIGLDRSSLSALFSKEGSERKVRVHAGFEIPGSKVRLGIYGQHAQNNDKTENEFGLSVDCE